MGTLAEEAHVKDKKHYDEMINKYPLGTTVFIGDLHIAGAVVGIDGKSLRVLLPGVGIVPVDESTLRPAAKSN